MSKREYLPEGALLNESDPWSTSSYPPQCNEASVAPTADCFDEQTGAYILGCKIGRSEVSPDALTEPNAHDVEQVLNPSLLMTGQDEHGSFKDAAPDDVPDTFQICWLCKIIGGRPEISAILCPSTLQCSIDGSNENVTWWPHQPSKNCVPTPAQRFVTITIPEALTSTRASVATQTATAILDAGNARGNPKVSPQLLRCLTLLTRAADNILTMISPLSRLARALAQSCLPTRVHGPDRLRQ